MPIVKKPKRVAMIVHRVGPYHFARARAAGKLLATSVLEMFKGDDVYAWDMVSGADGFERMTLFATQPQSTRALTEGLFAALDRCRPEAVAIPGWADTVGLAAMKWCVARRVPAVVMSESAERDEPRTFWKEWIKRRFLTLAAGGFVGGQPHVEYITQLGVPKERVFTGYDAVDNGYFQENAEKLKSETLKSNIRTKYGLPEKYFLASARFVEKKNLLRLIQAYARYRELALKSEVRSRKSKMPEAVIEVLTSDLRSPISDPWSLVLLGDGPLKAEICRLIADLGLQHSVLLPGFKQYDELPAYYGCASTFIHASTTEQWGLVVNEAMASGLPVLVSNRCGCAQDLVRDGVNGFTFDPYNVEHLAEIMFKISAFQDVSLSAFGDASRKIISNWGPERFAEGMSKAVEMAMAQPPPQPGWADRLLLELWLRM